MNAIEHYFENLIFHGPFLPVDPNKKDLTEKELFVVEMCYSYLAYTLFPNPEELKRFAENS